MHCKVEESWGKSETFFEKEFFRDICWWFCPVFIFLQNVGPLFRAFVHKCIFNLNINFVCDKRLGIEMRVRTTTESIFWQLAKSNRSYVCFYKKENKLIYFENLFSVACPVVHTNGISTITANGAIIIIPTGIITYIAIIIAKKQKL